MAFPSKRTKKIRARKKMKEGKERKRLARSKGTTKSKKKLFGD